MPFRGERIYWLDHDDIGTVNRSQDMPSKVDVAIVGAGYTGLTTAIHLARAGREVVVFDAVAVGHGASSRNGGMVGPGLHKLGITGLVGRYGEERATAILTEGLRALEHLVDFLEEEKIDCDLTLTGRFRGARTAAHYEASAHECDWLRKRVGLPSHNVPKAEQKNEIGSDFYHGGVVYERDGGLHPRKLLLALAAKALEAGARIITPCAVTGLRRDLGGSELQTALGMLHAKEVLLATNGYSDWRSAALNRRVVPIETGACAVSPLTQAQMEELTPKGRMHGETGRVFMWYRPTPDGRSFIFGGRFGAGAASLRARTAAFRRSIHRVFPQLSDTPLSHVWSGQIAYTADHSPHLVKVDGVWLAGGYCGSGVTRAVYFGTKLARRMLGNTDSETAFDGLPFDPVPFRPFAPWGAGMLMRWYQIKDNRDLRRCR